MWGICCTPYFLVNPPVLFRIKQVQARYSAKKPVKTFNLPPRQLSKVMIAKEVPCIISLAVPLYSPSNQSSRFAKECQLVNLRAREVYTDTNISWNFEYLSLQIRVHVATGRISPEASDAASYRTCTLSREGVTT